MFGLDEEIAAILQQEVSQAQAAQVEQRAETHMQHQQWVCPAFGEIVRERSGVSCTRR